MEINNKKDGFNNASGREISLDRAIHLFNEIADNTWLAFGFAQEACSARAHLICRFFEDKGIFPKKSWAFQDSETEHLVVRRPQRPPVEWSYHVAGAVTVRMPDGNTEDMVIDPLLFDGPATLKEWGRVMGASSSRLQIAPFKAPPSGYKGDYDPEKSTSYNADGHAEKVLGRYVWSHVVKIKRPVFSSSGRQMFTQMNPRSRKDGETWETMSEEMLRQPSAPKLRP